MQGKIKICSHVHKNFKFQTFEYLHCTSVQKKLKFFSVLRLSSAVSGPVRSKQWDLEEYYNLPFIICVFKPGHAVTAIYIYHIRN